MIAAGELRHRITIEQIQTTTQDAAGQDNSAYVAKATVWAKIAPKKGSDMLLQQIGAVEPTTTYAVTIRYPGYDLDKTTMRLNFAGTIYQITGVTYGSDGEDMIKRFCFIDAVEDK